MLIQIIATSVETRPSANGKSYQQLEVTYKNLSFQGKVEAKKLMSFGANGGAFKTLSTATPGSEWDVQYVKNDKGYNDWTIVVPAAAVAGTSQSPSAAPTRASGASASTPVRSTYETPEERAQRQILIVRQSSVSSAVAMLGAGAKAPVKLDEVLEIAQKLSDFVFQVKDPGPSGFEDLPDFDVPEVS